MITPIRALTIEQICERKEDLLVSNDDIHKLAKHVKEQAIDEFVERLKSDEFQKYNLDMVFETSRDLSYSHCINAFCEYIDEIAEQLKGGVEC